MKIRDKTGLVDCDGGGTSDKPEEHGEPIEVDDSNTVFQTDGRG